MRSKCRLGLAVLILFLSASVSAETVNVPLIGDPAPAFVATTTQGDINFPEDYKGKWVILFSHPADFTPVCTTEFMTFASMDEEFKALNAELVGVSIDSLYSHIAWLRTIKERIKYRDMSDVEVRFPVVADISMNVAKKYGMVHPKVDSTHAVRAVFFIDPKGIIRSLLYYPSSAGRNFAEIKRLLIALQTTDAFDVATPADWQPGEPVIVPPAGSCGTAAKRMEDKSTRCEDWFMCFRDIERETIFKKLMK